MSTLYLGTDSESLADRLAALVDQEGRQGDCFRPVKVVVPHRYLGRWLCLRLARKLGVAANLRFLYLEDALWEMLRAADPRCHPIEPELLDHDHYRLLTLSVLREEGEELAGFKEYLERSGKEGRNFCRRSWHLADHLARVIRDYEYHRQDTLIQKWLKGESGYRHAGPEAARLERGQGAVFQRIVRLPDGKRALLEKATGKVLKTLPQYAMEVMETVGPESFQKENSELVHLFGLTQVSALHLKTLSWLGQFFDLRWYHVNPLVGRLEQEEGDLKKLADHYRSLAGASGFEELLSAWGRAGAESLWLMAGLLGGPRPFALELVPECFKKKDGTVLGRLQEHLCGRRHVGLTPRRSQDTSLQIVPCPGIYREVETVYNSILDNLQKDPGLRQTDVAVLVTDLARYRPVLQAVFERRPSPARRVGGAPGPLRYNLANFSAAGLSTFGQALLGFFDLALEAFSRSQVFAVLLNPCLLARLGVDRGEALTWLKWAEQLGIYHGWDQRDKEERGYPRSPLFSWRLGLQRLRLGRLMEVAGDDRHDPAPRFHDVVPFADLASGDKDQLDAFCRAVEGLLPCLARLRHFQATGSQWADEIRRLMNLFLAVPPDRPDEGQVRDRLLASLDQLVRLDRLQAEAGQPGSLSLALVREFIQENLETYEGRKGEFLTGGVTISSLSSLRSVPFRVVYLLGLGEDLFPGPNALATFDLRAHDRHPGDIHPAENNRYLFLEALLSASDKVYLLYNNRDLQRDQELHPCVPLSQLRRYLESHILDGQFQAESVPLSGCDARFLKAGESHADVLVNYNEAERLLALTRARSISEGFMPDANQEKELERRLRSASPVFEVPPSEPERQRGDVPTVTTAELKRFLLCPAEAALRRHLRLEDEEEFESTDEEPFWTDALQEHQMVVSTLESFVARSLSASVDQAAREWQARFQGFYEDCRLRCQVPEGAFAEVDRTGLEDMLHERLLGEGGLADFLRRRRNDTFAGPILLGESLTPVHARRRFPALTLELGAQLFLPERARLVGSWKLAWKSNRAFELLVLTNRSGDKFKDSELCKPLLEPLLFCLALRAGTEKGPEGVSSSDWLGDLPIHLQVAHGGGISCFRYHPRELTMEKAHDYLTVLVADFLQPNRYDLLPFEVIVKDKELRAAYQGKKEELGGKASDYPRRLEEAIERDRDNDYYQAYRAMKLLDIVQAQVPHDALGKVRRRFHLLDRGPRRNRASQEKKKDDPLRSGQARQC